MHKEVTKLRRTFKRALALTNGPIRSKRSATNHHNKDLLGDETLAEEIAEQMKDMNEETIRKIRSGLFITFEY